MKKEKTNNKYETCVCCGEQLDILRSTPIETREYYIIGAGQLCIRCYSSLGGTTSGQGQVLRNSQMEYLIDRCQEK